jgi:ribose-phosphate pyrophosphokinase
VVLINANLSWDFKKMRQWAVTFHLNCIEYVTLARCLDLTKVLLGPASVDLGKRLAADLQAETVPVESKTFPDGESYVRIAGDIQGEKTIVVQSTYPPQDTHLIQLLQILDAARDLKASKIVAVVPYLAYSRQDKRFRPGEAVTVRTIVKMIETAGANSLISVDLHSDKILDLFKVEALNVSAMPAIGEYFSQLNLKDPYVFAPDRGALDRAKTVASLMGAEFSYFEKERDRVTGIVRTEVKNILVKGRDAIIADDIISTGSTIANAASILRRQGARQIYVACTHPLLLEGAKQRILDAGANEIIGTDCVTSDVSRVSVASVIAESLRKIL